MKKVMMIDPPSGWKYGFPKELTWDKDKQTLAEWLIENGYPIVDADFGAENSRFWEKE